MHKIKLLLKVSAIAILALAALPQNSNAQIIGQNIANDFYFPSADYDAAIPSPKSVLGYDIGDQITSHANIVKYFETLASALPNRVKMVEYGRTWEGRKLFYVVIGTEEQIANLETIKANSRALADPRQTNAATMESILRSQPNIVWLTNSVHGDEISPADSSIMTAYHLLAAKNDPRIANIRANSLVVLVPLQNPDGRERFLASNGQAVGAEPDDDEMAAERDQQWPGGRANHYYFDLNRDWFAMTQPESQGQVKAFLEFYPQVVVDAHEMSRNETFFFPPEADPINPNHTSGQIALRETIGRNNARWFDAYGINYFTRETFDGFYPGYGDGWPTTQGSIAMTYEQGSARGLVARGRDGSVLRYRDTVRNHFVAAMSTIEASANERERFLRNFYDFRRTAISEGQSGAVKSYIIPAQSDYSTANRLAGLLARQGIEVKTASQGFNACGRSFGANSHIISTAQPSGRLVRNLLENNIPLRSEFIARQQDRRARGLEDEIYDVTAWSLPLLYNIDVVKCNVVPNVATNINNGALENSGTLSNENAKVGFVVASGSVDFARFNSLALRAGVHLRSMEEGFSVENQNYPEGSVVALLSENEAGLGAKMRQLASQTGANIIGVDNSWVTNGPSLGSARAVRLKNPRIALAWDYPVDGYSAGATRYMLEQRLKMRATPLRIRNLRGAALSRFDVLILPDTDAGYLSSLGEEGVNNLKAYVQNGGVIIGLGGATRFLTAPNVDLLASRREIATTNAPSAPANSTTQGTNLNNRAEYDAAIARETADPTPVDGAILRTEIGESHWLNLGLKPNSYTMYQGSDIFRPLKRENGVNAIIYSGPEDLVGGGLVWETNQRQLAHKPFAMVAPRGRGFVIGFTADISYRAHSEGLLNLLQNAILQSTARANPIR